MDKLLIEPPQAYYMLRLKQGGTPLFFNRKRRWITDSYAQATIFANLEVAKSWLTYTNSKFYIPRKGGDCFEIVSIESVEFRTVK